MTQSPNGVTESSTPRRSRRRVRVKATAQRIELAMR
jgi:hypothetical protein